MNKKQQVVALTLAITLLLSGCSGLTIGSSEKQEQDTQQSLNVGQSTAQKEKTEEEQEEPLSNEKIPTEMESQGVFVAHYQDWDRESLPSQYLMEMDDTALMLIEQVQNVTADTQPVDLFDGIEHASMNSLLRVALDKTPAIDLEVEVVDGRIEAVGENYANHVLTKLLQNELEEGRDLREIYYQEDVTAVYSQLFGEGRTLSFQDLCPNYYYYAREGVFAHKGEKTERFIWPMLVGYTDSKVSMTVDLLLTERVDETQPLLYTKADGTQVELSAENYVEELAGEPVYRYTFDKAQDGHLVLDGVRCVGVLNNSCTDIVDQEEPLENDTLSLEAPEKVTVTSGEESSSIDLQAEYEGTTALYYLLDLLGDAQKVEDSAKEETLIGRGAAALTMDLDYTGEEQVQLKVYSQSYLPGIAQSYLLIQTAEGNDVQNYVLPQDDYFLLTDWMQACSIDAQPEN